MTRRYGNGKQAKLQDAAAHRQVRAEEFALAVARKQKTRDLTVMRRKAVRPELAKRVPRRSPSTKHAEMELHESTIVPNNVVRHASQAMFLLLCAKPVRHIALLIFLKHGLWVCPAESRKHLWGRLARLPGSK